MRATLLTIGVVALFAACGELPTGPSRRVPPGPSFSVGNGAHAVWVREEGAYANTLTTCDGEEVPVEGTYVRREQLVFLPTGGLRGMIQWVVRIHGTVPSSGVKYVGQLSWRQVHVYRGPDSDKPPTETRAIRLHGVTQGPSDNRLETLTLETVYGSGGGWTVVIKGRSACPG